MPQEKPDILIDLGKLTDLYSGLGQVSLQFGRALLKENNGRFNFTFLIPKGDEKYFEGDVRFEHLSLQKRYLPLLNKKYDLWHAVHQDSAYMPGPKNALYLLTIHDLNFLQEKSDDKARLRLQKLQHKVNQASAITTISDFTTKVVTENLQLKGKKVHRIYNGVEDIVNFPKQRHNCLKKGEPFLFTIGVIKEKKNFHVLVNFMAKLEGYKLIIAGNKSSSYALEIEKQIQQRGLQDKIILCGPVTAAERAYLYANCEAFLFPSKYEGFGLPAIEAMQFGKPVFLSTFSSLPEIGGVHAFYWENFDPDYMARFFNENMKYFNETPQMQVHEIEHARSFSWEKNAREYLNLYSSLLGQK